MLPLLFVDECIPIHSALGLRDVEDVLPSRNVAAESALQALSQLGSDDDGLGPYSFTSREKGAKYVIAAEVDLGPGRNRQQQDRQEEPDESAL